VNRDVVAAEFEKHRPRLRTVAYRMLGSATEADDAVQEAWLRLSRSDASQVENLGGWLTTVVGRVCLDMLRSRRSRREEPLEPDVRAASDNNPEQEALLADSLGIALLVVLETLTPAERVAFVMHDMFAMPFDEIATIVGRSEAATRQLASRARRRVQGGGLPDADLARRREIVDAFLAASRQGDFQALLSLLDPDAVARADDAAVLMGAGREARGSRAVAETFAGRARVARAALIDGEPGLVWEQAGKPRVVFTFTIAAGRIVAIDLIADQERIRDLDLA
jgi:RNA polymerase sigma-70 factor, ECF subfamily